MSKYSNTVETSNTESKVYAFVNYYLDGEKFMTATLNHDQIEVADACAADEDLAQATFGNNYFTISVRINKSRDKSQSSMKLLDRVKANR